MMYFALYIILLSSQFHFCLLSKDLAVVNNEVNQDEQEKPTELNVSELKDLYNLSKEISHDKGMFAYSEDGGVEYKRSFARKISLVAENEHIDKLLNELETGSTTSLNCLEELEYFVHRYETAIQFVTKGGIELVYEFTKSKNITIANAAFLVFASALQGNIEVQKYTYKLNILNIFSDVNTWPGGCHSAILAVLSSYIRNMPDFQYQFFQTNGIDQLSNILDNKTFTERQKMKIISLLSDLALEIYENEESISDGQTKILKRIFDEGILRSDVCQKIVKFLKVETYTVREKVIEAMKSLLDICAKDFKQPIILSTIENLLLSYNPNIDGNIDIDIELKTIIYKEIYKLYSKLTEKVSLWFPTSYTLELKNEL